MSFVFYQIWKAVTKDAVLSVNSKLCVCYTCVHGNTWMGVPMYAQAAARAVHYMSSIALYLIALRLCLSLNWVFTILARLVGQGTLRIYCL